jgi:hypothetical protein
LRKRDADQHVNHGGQKRKLLHALHVYLPQTGIAFNTTSVPEV